MKICLCPPTIRFLTLFSLLILLRCQSPVGIIPDRHRKIPQDVVKMTPISDTFPPILLDTVHFLPPVPMAGRINTAGAEDSPYITPDGRSFYFFFTPDVRVSAEKQLLDSVTGIYWAKKSNDTWTEPERVILHNDIALDGCQVVKGDTMWFASVRRGNIGEIDIYTARLKNGRWSDVRNVGRELNTMRLGEFDFSPDHQTLYFGWRQDGGQGGMDIWQMSRQDDTWGEPVNLGSNVNSAADENQPFVTGDGNELWFTRSTPGPTVWRCRRTAHGWGPAELIVSSLAGEPTLDAAGNLYFVHHYLTTGSRIIEADIYVCGRR